jgi:hypothetical protein
MVDRKMACAICKEKPPPLNPKRLKELQKRPLSPPEIDNEDEIAAEQLQREIYAAEYADDAVLPRSGDQELDREILLSSQEYFGFRHGNSSPGSLHGETHPVANISPRHVETHHTEILHGLRGTEPHEDDEALVREISLSLGNDVHAPFHAENSIHTLGNHSSLQDTSGDFALAMALSLQEGLYNGSQIPSPGLENSWGETETSQDEHYAREIERQLHEQTSEQVAQQIHRQLNEQASEEVAQQIQRQLNEQTSSLTQDEQFAQQIQRQLNEQTSSSAQDEQFAQQIQRQLNEQASPWTQPIPHRYPQSTSLWHPHTTPQVYTNLQAPVHPSGVEEFPYLQSAHLVNRRPSQHIVVGQPYYTDEYQSRGGWPGAYQSIEEGETEIFQRGTDCFMDESVLEKLRNSLPQLLIFAGLIFCLYLSRSLGRSCTI